MEDKEKKVFGLFGRPCQRPGIHNCGGERTKKKQEIHSRRLVGWQLPDEHTRVLSAKVGRPVDD